MQTAVLLKKEAPKTTVAGKGKSTTNPLQKKPIGEADDALQMKLKPLQLQTDLDDEDEPLQMKKAPVQLMDGLDDEEEPLQMKQDSLQLMEDEEEQPLMMKQNPLQLKSNRQNPLQLVSEKPTLQKKENNTGLPDNLKNGVESLSGYNMDDVKVHYNSDKPAQLQALAYAQGTDIHVGPGQEQHLPHEAWHVVQQKQGRVQPTVQMKGGVAVNDDRGLENEADVLGRQATGYTVHQAKSIRQLKCYPNSSVIQKTKEEHAVGDLHYGIHASRVDGYEDMPEVGGIDAPINEENPITVDELNGESGITVLFESGNNRMEGYFNVINMLNSHAIGSRTDKIGRWLDFLKTHIDYLSIEKHVKQIETSAGSTALPTKDRLAKNGPGGDDSDKSLAIIMDYYFKGKAGGSKQDNDYVDGWTWDVFFRKTSKLGIDFTVQEAKVIHMNTYVPASSRRGVPESRLTNDTANPQRSRQPITHSELRHVNRKYGINHPNIDMYYKSTGGNIERTPDEGKMTAYLNGKGIVH